MTTTAQPFLHITPEELLADTVERVITIPFQSGQSHQFRVTLPTSIDPLLDHPATYAAFEQDEYMPYWAELWPAALMLGQVLAQRGWPAGSRALEVGCGLGVSGLVALALGMEVIFSDYDAAALRFAAHNAAVNGFSRFQTLSLDWRHPPQAMRVPLILAADVIYETRHIAPLIHLIKTVLTPTGECWLADPDRPQCYAFQTALSQQGLTFAAIATRLERSQQPPVTGTVYRIRHAH